MRIIRGGESIITELMQWKRMQVGFSLIYQSIYEQGIDISQFDHVFATGIKWSIPIMGIIMKSYICKLSRGTNWNACKSDIRFSLIYLSIYEQGIDISQSDRRRDYVFATGIERSIPIMGEERDDWIFEKLISAFDLKRHERKYAIWYIHIFVSRHVERIEMYPSQFSLIY